MAYLQKPTLMSATPCYNPDTSNTGSGFEQVFDKRHGGCPTQELHAQIRKVSLWIFPARLLMRPGACSPPSCAHLCISVLCADWSLLVTSWQFSRISTCQEVLVHFVPLSVICNSDWFWTSSGCLLRLNHHLEDLAGASSWDCAAGNVPAAHANKTQTMQGNCLRQWQCSDLNGFALMHCDKL